MNLDTNMESVKLRRVSEFDNLELLTACYTSHSFPRHWHESFVVQVVESGVDEFHCRDTVFTAAAGSIVVFNPGEVHTGRPIRAVPLKYRSFYPTAEWMRDLASDLWQIECGVPYFPSPIILDPELARMLSKAHRILFNGSVESDGQSSGLLEALKRLILRHAKTLDPLIFGREKAVVTRAKQYIIENYCESISLTQLAAMSGMSPYYLSRTFRCAVGLPPHEYLLSIRIERAKELLTSCDSIAQVAYSTGFYDQSHFTRHFKHIRGLTPGQYLKNLRFTSADVN